MTLGISAPNQTNLFDDRKWSEWLYGIFFSGFVFGIFTDCFHRNGLKPCAKRYISIIIQYFFFHLNPIFLKLVTRHASIQKWAIRLVFQSILERPKKSEAKNGKFVIYSIKEHRNCSVYSGVQRLIFVYYPILLLRDKTHCRFSKIGILRLAWQILGSSVCTVHTPATSANTYPWNRCIDVKMHFCSLMVSFVVIIMRRFINIHKLNMNIQWYNLGADY